MHSTLHLHIELYVCILLLVTLKLLLRTGDIYLYEL